MRHKSGFVRPMKVIILPIGWLIGIIAVVAMGFRPDPYLTYVRQISPPHPYPIYTVLWIVFFITIHSGAVFSILRPSSYSYSWGRALSALILSVGFLVCAGLGAMHAPPAYSAYLWWLLVFGISMLGMFIYSTIWSVRRQSSRDIRHLFL